MTEPTIMVLIAYRAQAETADVAMRELRELIATVVATEPDCGGIRLFQDPADPTRILLDERWPDQDTYLGAHMQTPHLKQFIERAPAFLVGPPETSFWRCQADERRE